MADDAPNIRIRDDFNRPDEDPAVGWTDYLDTGFWSNNRLTVVSNALTAVAFEDGNSAWGSASYGSALDITFTVSTVGNATIIVFVRGTKSLVPSVAGQYIEARIVPATFKVDLYRRKGSQSFLSWSGNLAPLSAGDNIWVKTRGTLTEVLVQRPGVSQSWHSVCSAHETTLPQTGMIGVALDADTTAIDNWSVYDLQPAEGIETTSSWADLLRESRAPSDVAPSYVGPGGFRPQGAV